MIRPKSASSFTLVELLVVIGILAILTAAVVIVLNPAELLKQSRDSKRTTDLANLNNAIKLLLTQNPSVSLGTASTVYVSIADSSSTCGSLGLPKLPSGYAYHCAPAASLTSPTSSGWLPIDFTQAGSVASLPALPIDPQNASSSRSYYGYMPSTDGTYELVTAFESAKYSSGGGSDRASTDGGQYLGLYEKGSNLSLMPIDYGDASLAGWWPLDEGSGTAVADKSGNGSSGAFIGVPQWIAGMHGPAVSFRGGTSTDTINLGNSGSLNIQREVTMSAWVNMAVSPNDSQYDIVLGKIISCSWDMIPYALRRDYASTPNKTIFFHIANGTANDAITTILNTDAWTHVAGVYDGTSIYLYVNGSLAAKRTTAIRNLNLLPSNNLYAGGTCGERYYQGALSDIRIYSRALSAGEIQTIYNATK